jgi:glycosyltransferase involved in cell wall biosynthesis
MSEFAAQERPSGSMSTDRKTLPRVLFLIGSLDPGGSEGQLVTLLERTHGSRINATLAAHSPAADPRLTAAGGENGLPLKVHAPRGHLVAQLTRSVAGLARLLHASRPDLVYTWLEESTLLAAPMARLMRLPLMVARRNVSGPYAARPKPVVRAIYAAERLGLLATANSNAVAAETLRRGIPPERIRVIPNGHAAVEEMPLPSGDTVVLGYLARMRPEKGHRRLIRALATLQTDVAWRVDLGGEGPMQPEIEAEVRRCGLGERVRFRGPVDDVPGFWRGCDAAVLLSDHEGSPNALIEAAAFGRPIVATRVGGVPEFVSAGNGLLVDPTDDTAAALALRRMIEDRELRQTLGAAAHQQAMRQFSIEALVEGHCAAIDECLALSRR